jgi:hypothetical protein
MLLCGLVICEGGILSDTFVLAILEVKVVNAREKERATSRARPFSGRAHPRMNSINMSTETAYWAHATALAGFSAGREAFSIEATRPRRQAER